MGSVYARGGKLWVAYVEVDGKRKWQPAGLDVGQEDEARATLELIEARIRAERDATRIRAVAAAGPADEPAERGPITLQRFARRWLKGRKGRVRTAGDEEARVEKHILPRLGRMPLAEIRPKHVRTFVLALRENGELAPRTIRQIYAILRGIMKSAVIDELVVASPCVLEPGILPPNEDKDPRWRGTAIFERAEAERLISSELVPADRRVLYALQFLGALRLGEAAGLCWRDYDQAAAPLGRLTIAGSYGRAGTKTGVTRYMPVHATLARVLAAWRLSGWADHYGRKAKPDDLIVPTTGFEVRARKDASVARRRDLRALEMRHRRGHDLRRTFISLAQADGALPHILKHVTHGPPKNVIDQYTTLPWATLCAEVAKLKAELVEGKVVEMPRAVAAGAESPATSESGSAVTVSVTAPKERKVQPKKTNPPITMTGGPPPRGRPSISEAVRRRDVLRARCQNRRGSFQPVGGRA